MKNVYSYIKGINIEPAASSSIDAEGDVEIFSNGLRIYLQGAVRAVVTGDQTQTLTNKSMSGASNTFSAIGYSSLVLTTSIVNGDISASAAIAFSKLASLTSGNILVGNGSNVAVSVTPSGQATIDNAGAITLSNAAVIAKVLTGFSAGAGVVADTDTILQGFNKVVGNIAALGAPVTSLTGEATGTGPGATAVTLTNSAVIGKVLTGYTSGAGTVAATDNILQAIQKLNGNIEAAPGGDVTGPGSATDNAICRFDLTTGKIIQNSIVIISDAGGITGATSLDVSGGITSGATFVGQKLITTNTDVVGSPNIGASCAIINSFTGSESASHGAQLTLTLGSSGASNPSGTTTSSGVRALVSRTSTNATSAMSGVLSQLVNSSTGGAVDIYGVRVVISNSQAATNFYGFKNDNSTSTGAITNYYGAFLSPYSGTATLNRALHVDSGESFFGGILKASQNNNTVTGTGASMVAPVDFVERLTDGSLVSINNIVASSGLFFMLSNVTGNTIVITNDSGGTAADRIITGSGADISLENNASLLLYYDDTTTRWRVVGGSGAGGGANVALSNLSSVAINTSLISDTDNTDNLGSAAIRWGALYVGSIRDSGNFIAFNVIGRTLNDTSGTTLINLNTTNTVIVNTTRPSGDNTKDLGSASFRFANFYATAVKDASSTNVIDITNRQLTSGATVKLDWSTTDVSLNTRKLTSVSNPTAAQDAATKNYVDNIAVTTKTTAYTAVAGTDKIILCNASGGLLAIGLPAVSGNTGISFTIKKIDSSVNVVEIDADGSETIDGLTSQIISVQYQSITVFCDGSTWWIL